MTTFNPATFNLSLCLAATIKQIQPVWAPIGYISQHVHLCANKTLSNASKCPNNVQMFISLRMTHLFFKLRYRSHLIKCTHSQRPESLILCKLFFFFRGNLKTHGGNTKKRFNILFIEHLTHIHSYHYYFYKTT